MKTKLYKAFLTLATVAMMLCVSACGSDGNDMQATDAKEVVETEESEEEEPESSGMDVDTEESGSGDQIDEQVIGVEQYKDMAEKFALYCEYVW